MFGMNPIEPNTLKKEPIADRQMLMRSHLSFLKVKKSRVSTQRNAEEPTVKRTPPAIGPSGQSGK